MQTAVSEERLVQEAQAYSDEAWASIFDENYPKMLDYCYLRTGNRTVAEDLAADVFVEALRGIRRFRYRGTPLAAWLYRIAHNLTVDHLRRTAKIGFVPLEEQGSLSPAVADGVGQVDDQHDLRSAMRELTHDQQQVLALRFFHGLSHDETAVVMKRHPVAVRVLQNRALKSMRRVLGGGGR